MRAAILGSVILDSVSHRRTDEKFFTYYQIHYTKNRPQVPLAGGKGLGP